MVYGGSALRILYGLNRFSENLGFSLLTPNSEFKLQKYFRAIVDELGGFGLQVEVQNKIKLIESQISSAFIKADTMTSFIKIRVPENVMSCVHNNQNVKIKLEIDLDPPREHGVEVRDVFRPIPCQVKTMPLSDLFTGKMHAILARGWGTRVKGRDYYDYLWYLGRGSSANLQHLEARLWQSGHFVGKLTADHFRELLREKFAEIDIKSAIQDIAPFLKEREKASLGLWSNDYFLKTVESVQCLS